MIVLDTNVTSELMKPAPSAQVVVWVRDHQSAELYTTAITVAEIGYGIERLPDGKRRYDAQRMASSRRSPIRYSRLILRRRSTTAGSFVAATRQGHRSTVSTRR